MLHKAATTMLPEKIASGGVKAPIEIGTRGTVGNLVMKEIEFFKKLELAGAGAGGAGGGGVGDGRYGRKSSLNHEKKRGGGGGSNFWPSFGFLIWRRKKTSGGGGGGSGSGRFLPRVCTVVDVAEIRHHNHHRPNEIHGFNYRNLKNDAKQFDF